MHSVKVTTLSDIAERLGTSVNTVSRALRDCADIGVEMKSKVRQAAAEMGYRPSRVAAFMRTKKSNVIAVVISSLYNPFFSIVLDRVFKRFDLQNYTPLIIVRKGCDLSVDDVLYCVQNGASGILTFIDLEDETVDYCAANGFPLLLCGSSSKDERVSVVCADDRLCGELVAQEAIGQGSTRPCYINGSESAINTMRREGFATVLREARLDCDNYCFDYEHRSECVQNLKERILENGNDFVFCFNDEIAMAMLKIFEDNAKMRSSIFGIDGISKYLSYLIQVNSVGVDLEDMADRCAQILINRIESDDRSSIREILPPSLFRING